MTRFQNLLVDARTDQYWEKLLEAPPGELRSFGPIELGTLRLSIQASDDHSCCPRVTLDDATLYLSFEVSLSEIVDGSEVLLQPQHDRRFQKHPWARCWERSEWGIHSEAADFMPADEARAMCDDLAAWASRPRRARRTPATSRSHRCSG